MTLPIKGKVIDCTELPRYKDPKTGELGEKQFISQVMVNSTMKNGAQRKDLLDIKIDESKFNEYKSQVGKDMEFKVSLFSKSPISLTAI